MSLRDYARDRDKFELDPGERVAFDVAWPCCCCKNSECTDDEPPCDECDHNVNAIKPNSRIRRPDFAYTGSVPTPPANHNGRT